MKLAVTYFCPNEAPKAEPDFDNAFLSQSVEEQPSEGCKCESESHGEHQSRYAGIGIQASLRN